MTNDIGAIRRRHTACLTGGMGVRVAMVLEDVAPFCDEVELLRQQLGDALETVRRLTPSPSEAAPAPARTGRAPAATSDVPAGVASDRKEVLEEAAVEIEKHFKTAQGRGCARLVRRLKEPRAMREPIDIDAIENAIREAEKEKSDG